MKYNKKLLGYFLVLLAGISWGTGGLYIIRMSDFRASSSFIAFVGQFLGIFPILLYILIKDGLKGIKISKKGLLLSILLGIITKGIFKMLYDSSVILLGVSASTIVLYTAPSFAAILSVIFFKEELGPINIIALVLNLLACSLVITNGNFSQLNISGLGLVLGILAAICYSLSTILGKKATSEDNSITTSFYMLIFSSFTILPFAKPWENIHLITNAEFMFWASLCGFFVGSIANILFFSGLSLGVEASRATLISSSEVVTAALIGKFVLGEELNIIGVIGVILLLASIFLMNYPKARKTE